MDCLVPTDYDGLSHMASWCRVLGGAGRGDVAQLVEHLLCKQGVGGSSPLVSTRNPRSDGLFWTCFSSLFVSCQIRAKCALLYRSDPLP